MSEDEFSDFDMTEAEFDKLLAEGEPCEVVGIGDYKRIKIYLAQTWPRGYLTPKQSRRCKKKWHRESKQRP